MPTGSETIEIRPAAPVDRHGDPAGDAPEPVAVPGCITWPRSSLEPGRGWVTLDGLNIFLPDGAPVPAAEDQVLARGTVWDVEGAPAVYTGKGTIVALKRRG